jgi:OMF family outer membrane factor
MVNLLAGILGQNCGGKGMIAGMVPIAFSPEKAKRHSAHCPWLAKLIKKTLPLLMVTIISASPAAVRADGSQDPAPAPVSSTYSDQLPDLDKTHDQNSTLGMDQLRLHSSLQKEDFKWIRLEVGYDQSITLAQALKYAMDNNLAIKISKDNLKYQHYLLYGSVANALPNFSTAYNQTHTEIFNERVDSLAKVFLARVTYPVFQGGSVLQSILGQYYRDKGWKQAYKASINDELLDLYQKYNAVLLNRTLLQIRAKAVEVSEEQLRINKLMDQAGNGTRLAVAQADAQLSMDKQALLQQQVTMRQSALALNFSMNYPMAVNLVPVEETISEGILFQNEATIIELVNLALRNRPELREYEDFKVAASRNIQVAAAPLYPQVSLFQQYSYTNTLTTSQAPASSATSDTSGAGVFGGLFRTYQQGLAVVYSLNNMGLTSAANIFAAGSLSHQSRIQANQELQTVIQQVRSDYLNWRSAREQIDNAAHGARASAEELRLAKIRLVSDVATELEVVQGQRDYINSLTTQAQAIVNSNLAQAQLLHDTGLITADTLLHGFKGKVN